MLSTLSRKVLDSQSIEDLFQLVDELNTSAQNSLQNNAQNALQYLVDARFVSDIIIERMTDYLED